MEGHGLGDTLSLWNVAQKNADHTPFYVMSIEETADFV